MALRYLVRRSIVNTNRIPIIVWNTDLADLTTIPAAQEDRVIVYDDGGAIPTIPPRGFEG